MAKKKSLRHLAVLLLKKQYKNPISVLVDKSKLMDYKLKSSLPFKGVFWIKKPKSKPPSWLTFIQTGVKKTINLFNTSNSGVLFIKVSSRLFAFTCGHGRNLLDQNSIERDFGLKVTLNAVDPQKLRSIDMSSLEELPVQTRRQASVISSLDIFGIDIDRDVLRVVTGTPREISFAERITGADALAINSRLVFRELGEKCKNIMQYYESKKYQDNFSWYDRIKAVRETTLKVELDKKVSEMLKNGLLDNIYLAPPEPLDWELVQCFSFSCDKKQTSFADLYIDEYFKIAGAPGEDFSLDTLKAHRVLVRYSDGDELVSKWPVYECLVLQIEHKKHLYVLSRGQWFQVDKPFAKEVFDDIKTIPTQDDFLVRAKRGEKEPDYNSRAVQSSDELVLVDKKDIKPQGAATKVEFCDLLSRKKELIHVKRKTRSSSLSHLFFQGSNSAELFMRDEIFRRKIRTLIQKQTPNLSKLIPSIRPSPSEYTVVYAIITDGERKWPDSLPFFSQLSLRDQAQRLRGYGFKVTLARIIEQ